MSLLAELKRRNVFRVALAYLVFAWLVLQVGDVLFPALHLPDWSITLVAVLLAIGLVPVLVSSWVFELTPDGIRRESDVRPGTSISAQTGRKLNLLVVVMLVVAIGLLVFDRAGTGPSTGETPRDTTANDGPPVVAVLPFKAVGSDDGGFLAAGLHDDLLTRLAKLQAFRVISRTSMMEYAGTAKNMREIGAELGAAYILEGGVQAMGDRVRINAQLIDTFLDEHIWADTYDRDLTATDLFEVQSELALAIANQLRRSLSPADLRVVEAAPTTNTEAYSAYLRAVQHWDTRGFSLPGVRAIVRDAELAVELDPEFALAWARLSDAQSRLTRLTNDETARKAALDAYAHARALQPNLLEVELAWVIYLYHGVQEYEQALRALENVGERAAGKAEATEIRSYLYRRLGRFNDAYRTMLAASGLAPRDKPIASNLVHMAVWVGECEAAGRHLDKLLSLDPDAAEARVAEAFYEAACNGDARRANDLLRTVDFKQDWHLWAARRVAILANDQERLLELAMLDLPEPFSMNIAADLSFRAWVFQLTGREPEANALLDELATMLGNLDPGEKQSNYAQYARGMFDHSSMRGDPEQTLRWYHEFRRTAYPANRVDYYFFVQDAPWIAWNLADVGLPDEAVAVLADACTSTDDCRWSIIDRMPGLDVLDGHPGFEALRTQYRN